MFRRSVVPELVPGSEIVGAAKLRKREHENKTAGNPFLDHALIFSLALHLRVILKGVSRIFQRGGHRGYSPDCHAHLHAVHVLLNVDEGPY